MRRRSGKKQRQLKSAIDARGVKFESDTAANNDKNEAK